MEPPAITFITRDVKQDNVFDIFKIIDQYWDCCIAGNIGIKLIIKIFTSILRIFAELGKFYVILLLGYFIGFGIACSMPVDKIYIQVPVNSKNFFDPRTQIIEIPSKQSVHPSERSSSVRAFEDDRNLRTLEEARDILALEEDGNVVELEEQNESAYRTIATNTEPRIKKIVLSGSKSIADAEKENANANTIQTSSRTDCAQSSSSTIEEVEMRATDGDADADDERSSRRRTT